jgi:histidinol-phosphate aminotransferase
MNRDDAALNRVQNWVREDIQSLAAYAVPPAAGLIKLDAMENPHDWPPELLQPWLAAIAGAALNRYPDPGSRALLPVLRTALGIPDAAEVLLGNGSDELIQMLILAVARPGAVVLAPEPTFVMYRLIAHWLGVQFVGVPLRAGDFGLDRAAMLAAIAQHQPALVFLAYPNNPTGNLFDRDDVLAILDAAPGAVVVDEAYAPFASASFLEQAGSRPGLLVMRTLSKAGLAGLRLGVLAGPAAWIAQIDKVRLPYNINVLTQVTAEVALRHPAVWQNQATAICAERTTLATRLAALPGVAVYPSEANFLLFRVPAGQGAVIHEALRQGGVLVKSLSGGHPVLNDCLRVTVGKPDENACFLDILSRSLGQLRGLPASRQ